MCHSGRERPRPFAHWAWWMIIPCLALAWPAQARGDATLLLKDGRRLQGKIGKTSSLAEDPRNPKGQSPETITFVDDDLRRVFLPTQRIGQVLQANGGGVQEKIGLHQPVAKSGALVLRVGPIINITPFDEQGHRTFSMMTDKGRLDVVQGITQITPVWTKVEGLLTKKRPLIWDMRIATTSIPRETLKAILARRINPKDLENRLKIVRLFLQQERYQDAQAELEEIIKDFPDEKQLAGEVTALRQLHARRIVKEIEIRRAAGQHILAYSMLEQFPAQNVAGDILQQVREMLDAYKEKQTAWQQLMVELKQFSEEIKDAERHKQCEALIAEMEQALTINSLERMAAYMQFKGDAAMGAEQKLSLAFSGWLQGSNQANGNLMVTLSLARVRELVRQYLVEPEKLKREQLFQEIQGQEGASPAAVAQLIANMKPPLTTPDPSVAQPGFYKLQIPGIDREPDVTYYVQLPPQYDPYVRYPTILTLNGVNTTPELQIDWWAGRQDEGGLRLGQASRLGYIVIAVDWLKDGQKEYEFSAREHAAVLGSLRDACRRFSIDTDRVFLSGHSAGGNAAWDLGLAHPDLWAGVIPIVATSEKYCSHYWKNADRVPFYVVAGEKDGDKTIKNAKDLDRYLVHKFDVTVAEYIGRGHEDFYEDIPNIFDWMSHRNPRNFFPKQFEVATMRTWDNYFWWLEVDKLPEKGMVEPSDWPPPRGVRPLEIRGSVLATNGLSIASGSLGKLTVWLSPEVVDFSKPPITVKFNGASLRYKGGPDLNVLLEDVRTRADRQHPFWAKVEK